MNGVESITGLVLTGDSASKIFWSKTPKGDLRLSQYLIFLSRTESSLTVLLPSFLEVFSERMLW